MTEPITVILQTYRRTECALRTIRAAREHLRYPNLRWYIADDGSPREHFDAVLAEFPANELVGWHTERRGYGANANAAWDAAGEHGRLTFWLEDDWELSETVDLYTYAALLMEREDIGMVRLGYLNCGISGFSLGHAGLMYWGLYHVPHHDGELAFTGHPALRHQRYRDTYGGYPSGLTPGNTELAYAYQYRNQEGPWIVWPVAWPQDGLFRHIGTVKTETML
jgi:hypothetical protein